MAIHFFVEDVDDIKISKAKIKIWIKDCINDWEMKVGDINYIFCSDEYLRNINIEYLKHDYFTDIITFNYNEKRHISGDIYISTDRVNENANEFKVDYLHELRRVMVHGVLHLLGLNDETSEQKDTMVNTENKYLLRYTE